MPERCQATARNGKPCGAAPMPGEALCPWHSPAAAEQRRQWSAKGGSARSNATRAKKALPVESLTLAEVQGLLSVTLKGVIAGRIEPGVGNAVANLARALVAVAGVADFEVQLTELRRDLAELKGAS